MFNILPRIQRVSGAHARGAGTDHRLLGERCNFLESGSKRGLFRAGDGELVGSPTGAEPMDRLLQTLSPGREGGISHEMPLPGCKLCSLCPVGCLPGDEKGQDPSSQPSEPTERCDIPGRNNLTVLLLLAWEALCDSGSSSCSRRRRETKGAARSLLGSGLHLSPVCIPSTPPGRTRCHRIETGLNFVFIRSFVYSVMNLFVG